MSLVSVIRPIQGSLTNVENESYINDVSLLGIVKLNICTWELKLEYVGSMIVKKKGRKMWKSVLKGLIISLIYFELIVKS